MMDNRCYPAGVRARNGSAHAIASESTRVNPSSNDGSMKTAHSDSIFSITAWESIHDQKNRRLIFKIIFATFKPAILDTLHFASIIFPDNNDFIAFNVLHPTPLFHQSHLVCTKSIDHFISLRPLSSLNLLECDFKYN